MDVCLNVNMFSSDDENFVLSQKSDKIVMDTQSFGYGQDVIDGDDKVVSLEVGDDHKFTINMKDLLEAGPSHDGQETSRQVFIEDISSDEELEKM